MKTYSYYFQFLRRRNPDPSPSLQRRQSHRLRACRPGGDGGVQLGCGVPAAAGVDRVGRVVAVLKVVRRRRDQEGEEVRRPQQQEEETARR